MHDLENLIANYHPSSETKRRLADSPLVLIIGISGAGKDAIIDGLVKTGEYYECVSFTTRPPRLNDGVLEVDGQEYHFINQEQAKLMLRGQQFIEAKLVHGTVYGSALTEIIKAREAGKIPVNNVDVQGASEYLKLSSNVRAIFILPPSFEIWHNRLQNRYSSPEEFNLAWPKRRDSAIHELEFALNNNQYIWVVNDDLAQAVKDCQAIVVGEKPEANQYRQLAQDLLIRLKQS